MAIVKMRKLNMVALSYDKDVLLNALHETGAVEIVERSVLDGTTKGVANADGLKSYIAFTESALFALQTEVENYQKQAGVKSDVLKDGFDVSYTDFMSAGDKKEYYDEVAEKIRAFIDKKNALKGELIKAQKTAQALDIYQNIRLPFSVFSSTQNVKSRLGVVFFANKEAFFKALSDIELCAVETLNENSEQTLVFVASHKDAVSETNAVLSSFGFADCQYTGDTTGETEYAKALEEIKRIQKELEEISLALYNLSGEVKPLKVYIDYLYYQLEKEEANEKLSTTQTTFILQAF